MFSTGGEVALDITEGKLFSEGNLEERQRADQETWDRLVHQGVHLLERFAQDNRIRIPQPQQNLQLKVVRELPNANQFVAYVDAIGELDGLRCRFRLNNSPRQRKTKKKHHHPLNNKTKINSCGAFFRSLLEGLSGLHSPGGV